VTEADSTETKGEQDSCWKGGREKRRGSLRVGYGGKGGVKHKR